MGDEPKAKWADETFELLQLFQRFGSRLPGLLALEVGWALLLVLVAGLSSPDSVPVIELPWFSWTESGVTSVPLTTVFTAGALVILVLWILGSGLYLYLWVPARRLARQLLILTLHIGFFGFLIAQLPVQIVLALIEPRKRAAWEARQAPEHVEALKKEYGASYNTYVRAAIKFSPEYLIDRVAPFYAASLTRLVSTGYIGLSPFYSHSLDEERKASKAPLQIFASAIGRLRLSLGQFRAAHLFQFVVLPTTLRPESHNAARRLRWWFGQDILLWGSYVSGDAQKIWLNLERRLPLDRKGKSSSKERFHPLDVRLGRDTSMTLNQADSLDTYIAVILALLEALDARRIDSFRLYPEYSDTLRLAALERDGIMSQLIRDTLFAISALEEDPPLHASVKRVLVSRASDWAADQISRERNEGESSRTLKAIISRCAELEPNRPEHHYRLGAIYCLLGMEDEAKRSLETAQGLDHEIRYLDPGWPELSGWLTVDLLGLRVAASNEERAAARAAAYVARLAGLQRDDVERGVLKQFADKDVSLGHELRTKTGSISGAEKVLYALVGLGADVSSASTASER